MPAQVGPRLDRRDNVGPIESIVCRCHVASACELPGPGQPEERVDFFRHHRQFVAVVADIGQKFEVRRFNRATVHQKGPGADQFINLDEFAIADKHLVLGFESPDNPPHFSKHRAGKPPGTVGAALKVEAKRQVHKPLKLEEIVK